MKKCLSRLFAPALALSALILSGTPSAWADRPWQDATSLAHTLDEHPLTSHVAPLLVTLPDGTPFTLDTHGTLQRIDPVDATLYPQADLPALSALSANTQGLWAISSGNKPALLNIAPNAGTILNRIPLTSVTIPESRISALQVTEDKAYLADEGAIALIVVDLQKGTARRLLEGSPSLGSHAPLIQHGHIVTTETGAPRSGGNVRFMALDHTGKWLFYQTPTGPLYRLGTDLLIDPNVSPAEQIEGMANWRRTPSLGGLVMDDHDTFYMLDIEDGDLLAFGSDRIPLRLLHDERLYRAKGITFIAGTPGTPHRLAILLSPQDSGTHSTDNHDHLLEIALP